jgi:hypothetical protein
VGNFLPDTFIRQRVVVWFLVTVFSKTQHPETQSSALVGAVSAFISPLPACHREQFRDHRLALTDLVLAYKRLPPQIRVCFGVRSFRLDILIRGVGFALMDDY